MPELSPPAVLYTLMFATAAASMRGFADSRFFQEFMFNVGQIRRRRQYYRLASSAFLHADWGHLLVNMLVLYLFAPNILNLYGALPFLLLYFGAVLAGNLFSLFVYQNRPLYTAIGASGGVSGIVFASIALNPEAQMVFLLLPGFTFPAWVFATLYFAYSVYMMLNPRAGDNTGHAAHLGGAVCGMLFVLITLPAVIAANAPYIAIMSLPLAYMAFRIFSGGRRR